VNDAFIEHVARSVNGSAYVPSGFSDSPRTVVELTANGSENLVERVLQLRQIGLSKEHIILEIWSARKGGGPKYKAAECEYNSILEVLNED
jgi:hypothetical protein